MYSYIALLLCIPVVLAATFKFPEDTPDELCNCIRLNECYSVVSKLKWNYRNDRIVHKAYTKYLGIINCGYYRHQPFVCCPNKIPSEVVDIVENKKYWTKSQEQASIKKLRCATLKAKNLNALPDEPSPTISVSQENQATEQLKIPYQFPNCGRYNWKEHTGNRTDIGDYPWLALLEYDTPYNGKQFLCGGVLISDQHILTAARCVTSLAYNLSSVILGEYDTNANPECMPDGGNNPPFCVNSVRKYEIGYSIIHNDYYDGISHRGDLMNFGAESDLHDIALIKLKKKVELSSYIQPICLPTKRPTTKLFRTSGWGRSFVPGNKGLNLKLVSYLSECRQFETERHELVQIFNKNEHICAGNPRFRQEPCIVDSGGPLMADEMKEDGNGRMTVYGISYMESTCQDFPGKPKNLPAIFTNVYNYKDWIIKHMNA